MKRIIRYFSDVRWQLVVNYMAFYLLGIMSLVTILNVISGVGLQEFTDGIIVDPMYKLASISYYKSNYTEEIAQFCSGFEGEAQVKCVVDNVDRNYEYVMRHDTRIKDPDAFVDEGGLCRDVAITYDIIFQKLGWSTDFDFDQPKHVYNWIWNSDMTCEVNGRLYECYT